MTPKEREAIFAEMSRWPSQVLRALLGVGRDPNRGVAIRTPEGKLQRPGAVLFTDIGGIVVVQSRTPSERVDLR